MDRLPLSSLNLDVSPNPSANIDIQMSFGDGRFGLLQFNAREPLERSELWKQRGVQHPLPIKEEMHRFGIISDLALIIILLAVFPSVSPSKTETVTFKKISM